MKTNKRLVTSTFCKNVIKQFVTIDIEQGNRKWYAQVFYNFSILHNFVCKN